MQNQIKIKDESVILSINPKVYDLDTVYSAAYVFLDKAYILLDGDRDKEIIVSLKPRSEQDPEKLGHEFMNELINYGDYKRRSKETKKIRETLLQRALITNDPDSVEDYDQIDQFLEDDDDFLDDPDGIAIPWEEKYGKEDDSKTE